VSDIPPDPSSWLFKINSEHTHHQREQLRRFLDLSSRSFDREVDLGNIILVDDEEIPELIQLAAAVVDPPPVEAPAAPVGQ
jgi:hypothetical protein